MVSQLFSAPRIRDWFYYRARHGTAERFKRLAKPGQSVTVIGDAVPAAGMPYHIVYPRGRRYP